MLNSRLNLGALTAGRVFQWIWVCLIAFALISVGMLVSERSRNARKELEDKKGRLAVENRELIKEIKAIERRVTLLRTEPKLIERVAKRKLGMARPDETVYIFSRKKRETNKGLSVTTFNNRANRP